MAARPRYRHEQDFEFIEFLGAGAFGEVHKVRNRLDGRAYSLKIVKLPHSGSSEDKKREKILREARLLSSLSNERIARYFGCWVEEISVRSDADRGGGAFAAHSDGEAPDGAALLRGDSVYGSGGLLPAAPATGTRGESSTSLAHLYARPHDAPPSASATGHASGQGGMSCGICSMRYRDWYVHLSEWGRLEAGLQPMNLCLDCYRMALQRLGFDTSKVAFTVRDDDAASGAAASTRTRSHAPQQVDMVRTEDSETATYLFIQTEFCDRTLMQEIDGVLALDAVRDAAVHAAPPAPPSHAASVEAETDARYKLSESTVARVWALFWEIVEGLAYLHTCNVVHRDLKPSNIFSSGALGAASVKIGDLGLATTVHPVGDHGSGPPRTRTHSQAHDDEVMASQDDAPKRREMAGDADVADARARVAAAAVAAAPHAHEKRGREGDTGHAHHHHRSRGVGTYFFMAPEAGDGVYTDRSDMFSLGVCLYEMWAQFRTGHERARMLQALKTGAVPRAFLDAFPVQAQLMSNLLQESPSKRPSASDLLRYRFFLWAPAPSPGSPSGEDVVMLPEDRPDGLQLSVRVPVAAQRPAVVVEGEGIMPSPPPSTPRRPVGADGIVDDVWSRMTPTDLLRSLRDAHAVISHQAAELRTLAQRCAQLEAAMSGGGGR